MRTLVALMCACLTTRSAWFAQAQPTPHSLAPAVAGELRLTYLGNAGWEITDGRTVILVDPFISEFSLYRGRPTFDSFDPNEIATPDSAGIDTHVHRADYILITHGHLDHMLDAPYIARRTGAVIIGHETAANLARAYAVPDSQLITVRGGEDFQFDRFSVKVIPSIHTALFQKRYYNRPSAGMTAPRDLKAPLRISAFPEGGSLAYLLRIGGHEVLIMGSMNYIEREMLGLRPDVALVGANAQRREIYDYSGRLMRALGYPALVIPTHADSYSMQSEQTRVAENMQAFAKEITTASPTTRIVLPKWFEPIVVPARRR